MKLKLKRHTFTGPDMNRLKFCLVDENDEPLPGQNEVTIVEQPLDITTVTVRFVTGPGGVELDL